MIHTCPPPCACSPIYIQALHNCLLCYTPHQNSQVLRLLTRFTTIWVNSEPEQIEYICEKILLTNITFNKSLLAGNAIDFKLGSIFINQLKPQTTSTLRLAEKRKNRCELLHSFTAKISKSSTLFHSFYTSLLLPWNNVNIKGWGI